MDFKLVVARGKARSKTIKLKGPRVTIGRATDCDLRIPSQKVSRKHCEIVEQDDHLAIRDLGSSNGTYVNDEKVEDERTVQPGDELAIGPIRFVIQYQTEAAEGSAAERAATPPEVAVAAAEGEAADQEDVLEMIDLKMADEAPAAPKAPKPAAAGHGAKKAAEPAAPAKAKVKGKPAGKAKTGGKSKKAAPAAATSDEDLAAMLLGLGEDTDDEDSSESATEQFKLNLEDK